MSRLKRWSFLVLFIVLAQMAGIIGSFFTADAIGSWYIFLDKPTFTPPGWVFGPVWVTLYALMGIATYIVWNARSGLNRLQAQARDRGFWLFWVHLVFNALWSILFFGFQNPLWGLIDIAVLGVMVLLITIYYLRVSTVAGGLMLLYFVWILYAAALNLGIFILN